jgi:hypothetical protein
MNQDADGQYVEGNQMDKQEMEGDEDQEEGEDEMDDP